MGRWPCQDRRDRYRLREAMISEIHWGSMPMAKACVFCALGYECFNACGESPHVFWDRGITFAYRCPTPSLYGTLQGIVLVEGCEPLYVAPEPTNPFFEAI